MVKRIILILKTIFHDLENILFFPINWIPGVLGNKFRYLYYKKKLKYLGKNAVIDIGVHIVNPQYVVIGNNSHIDKYSILVAGPLREGKRVIYNKTNSKFTGKKGQFIVGDNVYVAPNTLINSHGGVMIQDNTSISSGVKMFSVSNHYRNLNNPEDLTMYTFSHQVRDDQQCIIMGAVVMEKNSGVGLNSVILPGATIEENSWVGSMSCVVNNIPSNVIASGNPAKVLKERSI